MAFREAIKEYVGPLLRSKVMTTAIDQWDTETLVKAWAMLRYTQEVIDARLQQIRLRLMERAAQYGKATDKGGNRLIVEGTEVTRERRVASLPDEKTVRRLLEENGLKVDQAFSKVTKVVLDASKLQTLVDLGKLPEAEIDAARKVVWALRVKEASDLIDAMDELAGNRKEETVEDKPARKKRSTAVGPRKGK